MPSQGPISDPTQPPINSGWNLSTMSSYLGELVSTKISLLGQCRIWLQSLWKKVVALFFSPPEKSPTKETSMAVRPSAQNINAPKSELDIFTSNFTGPIKDGGIRLFKRTANYIGYDKKYQFSNTIRLINGEPLKISPKDFYCDVEMTKEPTGSRYQELPSCLFSQARIGNKVCFVRDGTLHILTLDSTIDRRGKKHFFDGCLRAAARAASDSMAVFRYDEDIPDDYFEWYSGIPKIYLSPFTQRIQLGVPGTIPLDFGELYALPSREDARVLAERCSKELYTLVLEACGQPPITILLDGRRLMVLIDHSKHFRKLPKGWNQGANTIPNYAFFIGMIPLKEEKFNPQGIHASLNDAGHLTITVPAINSTPNKPPSPQDTPQG